MRKEKDSLAVLLNNAVNHMWNDYQKWLHKKQKEPKDAIRVVVKNSRRGRTNRRVSR